MAPGLLPRVALWGEAEAGAARDSLLLLRPEVRFDDQAVHGKVNHQGPHGGVEHGAGQQLVRQVDGEEVGLAGPVQPGDRQAR